MPRKNVHIKIFRPKLFFDMEVTKEGLRRLKIPNTGLAATQAQGEEQIFSEQKLH